MASFSFTVGDFERVVQLAVEAAGPTAFVAALSEDVAQIGVRSRSANLVVVRWRSPSASSPSLEAGARLARSQAVDLILVGGTDDARRTLKAAVPRFSNKRVGIAHVDDERTLWSSRTTLADTLLRSGIDRLDDWTPSERQWAAFIDSSERTKEAVTRGVAELDSYAKRLQSRRPVATYSLIAVIAAMYGVELLLGGPGSTPVLVRLGGLAPELVHAGGWWRLMASAFLHGSATHVLLNSYVLFILGVFVERLIGPARFVFLYALSALGGGMASVLFSGASISVGASGAIWGLLGAHAIIAFRPEGLIPAIMVPGARRAAGINLMLNVFISFLPYVDASAHFGGGIVGALLWLSGVVTTSVPRLTEDGALGSQKIETPPGWWLAFAVSGGLLLSGPVIGLTGALSPSMFVEAKFETRTFEEIGVQATVPEGLAYSAVDGLGGPEIRVGSPMLAPTSLVIKRREAETTIDAQTASQQIDALVKNLERPAQATNSTSVERFTSGDDPGFWVRYTYPSGLRHERAAILRVPTLVVVEAFTWPDIPASASSGVAQRVAESAEFVD